MDGRRSRRRAGHHRPPGAAHPLHEHDITGPPGRPTPRTRWGLSLAETYLPSISGTITERFPTPVALTRSFLVEAYTEIGLAAGHIEQLTEQPAGHVVRLLHEHGIPIRIVRGPVPLAATTTGLKPRPELGDIDPAPPTARSGIRGSRRRTGRRPEQGLDRSPGCWSAATTACCPSLILPLMASLVLPTCWVWECPARLVRVGHWSVR